jgi:hypothetical protein
MSEDEKVGVLYNTCYGGFCLSYQAITLINRRYSEIGKPPISELSNVTRSDPIIVDVFNTLGTDSFSGRNSQIGIEYVKKRYTNFIRIDEYDGMETVIIDYSSSVITQIDKILNNDQTDSEKLSSIKYSLNNMFSDM